MGPKFSDVVGAAAATTGKGAAQEPGALVLPWLVEQYGVNHTVGMAVKGNLTTRSLENGPEIVKQLKSMRPDVQRAVMQRMNTLFDTRTDASLERSLAMSRELGIANSLDGATGNALHDYARELGITPSWQRYEPGPRIWRP